MIPQSDGTSKSSSSAVSFLVIFAAAALAVAPELIWGDSCGHDFDFHLVSWFDALNAWHRGIPYPHWTPSANFGAGEPRFVFYSPLTWMLGAALGALIPWSLVPVALTFLILCGTGLATRALARAALSEGAASLAGCIAIFSGYPLFTAYERSAFAELAGGVWIPLVLLYGLRDEAGDAETPRMHRLIDSSIVPLAIAIAGAWLSNPTVGVMASYSLAAITIIVALQVRSLWPILRNSLGATLGLGLAAVYLLPAAWEQRWVDIHQVTEDPGQTLENNWLFARHADPALAFHDEVLHTASMIVVSMVALTALALVICRFRGKLLKARRWYLPLGLIPVVVLLLQFSFSRPLWTALPDLRFLQFPWRWLLVLEAPMAVFLAAAVWPSRSTKFARAVVVAGCIAAFVCIAAAASKYLFQACYPEDTVPAMVTALSAGKGYAGTSEYEPIGADISLIPMNLPEACLTVDPAVVLGKPNSDGNLSWDQSQRTCDADYSVTSSAPEHLRITGVASHPGFLIIRLLTYPAWKVALNGNLVRPNPSRHDGLTTLEVPQGPFNVAIDWTTTRDVILARWLTAVSVLALTGIWLYRRKLTQSHLS